MASLEQERDKAKAELAAQARELADKAKEVSELQEQQRIDSSEADVLKTEVKAQQEQVNCLARDVEWLCWQSLSQCSQVSSLTSQLQEMERGKAMSEAKMEEAVGAIKTRVEEEARRRLEEVESLTVQLASREQEGIEMASKVQEERARAEQERADKEQEVEGLRSRLREKEEELGLVKVKVPQLMKELEEKTVQLDRGMEQVGSPGTTVL